MNQQNTFLHTSLHNLREFLKSTDVSKAVLMGIALTLPILFGIQFHKVQTSIVITVGALLASPSDTSGSLQSKIKGILLSALLAMTVSVIGGYLRFSMWAMFPLIGLLMFGISYFSIFGFRASLISFSGLFALVLSFSPVSGDMPPIERSLLIGMGGLWYAFMALVWHYSFPKAPTDFYLSKTFNLTADFLRIRGHLVSQKNERSKLLKELLQIQSELTETHETLRDILISRRIGSGKSIYHGKRLLIFATLIDMLEQAMANPVNYAKTDVIFAKKPQHLADFKSLLFEMADRLDEIGEALSNPRKLPADSKVRDCLSLVKKDITELSDDVLDTISEDTLMLRNLYKYQEEQVKKIEKIEWLLIERDRKEIRFIKDEEAKRFLTTESYDFDIFLENFNFDSSIFRHSLRIAVVAIIGYAVGIVFELQNSYWILLTIIVIMRPNYGLTKKRSVERTIGTLIGGALAVLIVLWIKSPVVYGILSIITLVISFSMVQRNYRAAAIFLTLSVVFTYTLLTPDIFDVIKYRVTDTVIGTGLAILGNLLLWPAWEIQSMQNTLLETIQANRKYFNQIVSYYKDKGEVPSEYKIARKKTFLMMSNLSTAFQRMTQEPKSQQKNLEAFYEIVELNQTFLSSLASLSTYIINNPTTPASENFEIVTSRIDENLLKAETVLKHEIQPNEDEKKQVDDIFDLTFGNTHILPEETETLEESSKYHQQIEEAHLVREQLKWLLAISKKMSELLEKTPV